MPVDGARVKALREYRGLEVGQVAYKTGISKAHIYRIESNERPNASAALLGQIADVLGTTVDYLLGRTDDPRPVPVEDFDDDPELILRRQQLAERVAKLPPYRQRAVMEAVLLLVEAEKVANAVEEPDVFPDSEETEQADTGDS